MDVLNIREILTKKPFFTISSTRNVMSMTPVTDKHNTVDKDNDKALYYILSQEEMLRQYYPSGHKINNELLFPDIWKKDPETNKWYKQSITRCALAFQQIITTKHIIHIVGNDVQFELSEDEKSSQKDGLDGELEASIELQDDDSTKLLSIFKSGWIDLDMEIRFYEAVRSYMITADCAIVGFIQKDGTPSFRTFSFLNDDKLYPHLNSITGEMELFARKYYDYDDEGEAVTEWVEVWDDTYIYRCKHSFKPKNVTSFIKTIFGLNGFEIVEQVRHGFPFCPVAYARNEDGPCWAAGQQTIENFEEALSYFFENNKAFAFPILLLSGDGIELHGDMNGSVKSISIDSSDGDAHFLENNDISASYNTLLTKFYDLIYEQTFTVKPPELKSGDLPGVALKLLYSPAIECAICDAQKLQPFLNKLVKMVKFSWGLKKECQADLMKLGINAWIEPYVHQNDSELVTNLATAVQNNIISCKTASERLSKYTKNDEFERILKQLKFKMQMNVEEANLKATHSTNERIREEKIKSNMTGQDINTGGGKRHINETDENGNREGENNWEEYNQKRF